MLFASLFLVLAVNPASADAAGKETPTSLPGGTLIDAEQLASLMQAGSAVLLDTRSILNYGKSHIPGAHSAAYQYSYQAEPGGDAQASARLDTSSLPADRSTPVVVYSHGSTGWKSFNAAKSLIEDGYENVMWFRGGLQSWIDAGNSLNKN